MQRKFWLVTLAMLMLLIATPVALAQGQFDDVVILNKTYTLATGERLTGNLAIVGGSATLERGSIVEGDVAVFGGRLLANGTITGSVAALGGRVSLGESAEVAGSLAALGGSLDRAPGAVIRGETLVGLRSLSFGDEDIWSPRMEVRPPLNGVTGALERFFFWQLRTFGAALLLCLLGVVALLVAPTAVDRVAYAAAKQSAVSFGMGLLTLVLALFAGALLLIACGLGLLVWLLLLGGLVMGWIGVGLSVGRRLLDALGVRPASSLGGVIAGVLLITVLAGLPLCIGFFIWLIVGSIGLGAVVLTRFGTQSADGDVPSPSVT